MHDEHVQATKPAGHHGHHGHATEAPFSEKEIAEFRQDDIQSGRAIIFLMSAIFTVGAVLYAIVAICTYP